MLGNEEDGKWKKKVFIKIFSGLTFLVHHSQQCESMIARQITGTRGYLVLVKSNCGI